MFQGCVFLLPLLSECWNDWSGSMAHRLSTSPTSPISTSCRLVELLFISSSISYAPCCRKTTKHTTCV